jgi:hypothetical protein
MTTTLNGTALLAIPVTTDLPVASNEQLGGVMVQSDSGILIDESGDISVDDTQFLSVANAESTYLTQSNASSTYATQTSLESYAPLASPALTGNPTAPTQSLGDDSTNIATTAFVQSTVGSISGNTYVVTTTNATEIIISEYTVPSNASLVGFYGPQYTPAGGSPTDQGGLQITLPVPISDGHTVTLMNLEGSSLYGTLINPSPGTTVYASPGIPGITQAEINAPAGIWVYIESLSTWCPVTTSFT